jgi:phosphoribosylaminoimidazole-succinocarboxamide synthase
MTKKLELTSQTEKDIIRLLMNGMPLTQICSKEGSPSLSKVYSWVQENKEFADKIITARRIACQTYLDRMISELEEAKPKDIGLLRERLQHFRWMASKLIPIYGDKQEVKVDQKIEITWNQDDDKTYENEIKNVSESSVAST